MSQIDYTALITPRTCAADACVARTAAIKAECAEKITAVLDARTLSNLHGAVLLKELSREHMATFSASQHWLRAMQNACRDAIKDGSAPVWPGLPDGVAALMKEY